MMPPKPDALDCIGQIVAPGGFPLAVLVLMVGLSLWFNRRGRNG